MSGRHEGESSDARKDGKQPEKPPSDKSRRRQRAGDIGRALRSVYDDTLREDVPDDFRDLLGKLS